MAETPILETKNLVKHFEQPSGIIRRLFGDRKNPVQAVDGVDIQLRKGESTAVIGESGCGKTTLLLTLMGLEEPTSGEIFYKGEPVSAFTKQERKEYRRNVSIIFQDPFNSLDPKHPVRETLLEPLKIHKMDDHERRVREALEYAELTPPEKYLDRLPKHLSGGERQRVSIARALISEPDVILADEPVSMLDVSTQAAILRLLSDLVERLDVSMCYISHDLSTVSTVSDWVNVMYLGRVVESGPIRDIIDDPLHPYSQALINAIPIPDPHHDRERTTIEGAASDPIGIGDGCRFRDRCPERMDICEVTPEDIEMGTDRKVACHLYYEHEAEEQAPSERDEQVSALEGE